MLEPDCVAMSSPSHWQKICDDIVKSLNPDGATKFQFLTFLVKQFQDDNQEVAMVETNLDGRPTIVVQLCQEKQLSLKPLTNKMSVGRKSTGSIKPTAVKERKRRRKTSVSGIPTPGLVTPASTIAPAATTSPASRSNPGTSLPITPAIPGPFTAAGSPSTSNPGNPSIPTSDSDHATKLGIIVIDSAAMSQIQDSIMDEFEDEFGLD